MLNRINEKKYTEKWNGINTRRHEKWVERTKNSERRKINKRISTGWTISELNGIYKSAHDDRS